MNENDGSGKGPEPGQAPRSPAHAMRRIIEGLGQGNAEGLLVAASYLIIIDEFGPSTPEQARAQEWLGYRWHLACRAIAREKGPRHEEVVRMRKYLDMMYDNQPPAGASPEEMPFEIPARPSIREKAPPISDAEAEWLLRCFESEDQLREAFVYAGAAAGNGVVPVRPLITISGIAIWGADIAPKYRDRQVQRPWGKVGWTPDEGLIEDLLLITAMQGRGISARRRADLLRPLVPYLRGVDELGLAMAAVNATRRLSQVGMWAKVGRQRWGLSARGITEVTSILLPQWLAKTEEDETS